MLLCTPKKHPLLKRLAIVGRLRDACPNSIVVQGTPHWLAKSNGSDIPECMFDFTRYVFDTLLKNLLITKCYIIAESQAVPGVQGLFSRQQYTPFPLRCARSKLLRAMTSCSLCSLTRFCVPSRQAKKNGLDVARPFFLVRERGQHI